MKSSRLVSLIIICILIIFAVVQTYPVVWVALASLKTPDELVHSTSYSLPQGLYFGNYKTALDQSNIPRGFLNSTIIAVITLFLEVAIACPAAFSISKLRFKQNQKLLNFFLMGMMIPAFMCLIPMFHIYNSLGITNTFVSVILPQIGFAMPLCIYIYTSFFTFLPNDILEATVVDGCNTLRTFLYVVIPMSVNTTITIITFQFIFVWNEFTYANTFLTTKNMKTLPICLKDFAGEFGAVDWSPTFAAIVVAILPTLIIYFILNKKIIEGVAAGAVKS